MSIRIIVVLLCATIASSAQKSKSTDRYVIVIHGGAGTLVRGQMSEAMEKQYTEALKQALDAGFSILKNGGSSLDAVEASVKILEDNPLFNAGKGAVFTNEGKNELDAAIMNGKTLGAGSVAGVTTIKNPVSAARAVMERSNHVMMVAPGAEKFAQTVGLEIVDPSYFRTEERWNGLQRAKKEDSLRLLPNARDSLKKTGSYFFTPRDVKFGTVGAVALDQHGDLAAATSTGGMTNKKFGRVGDAPIIGAGTYANNLTCAISCTGYGEYFIRLVMAKTISDMMEFGKTSLKAASDEMIMRRLPALHGDGGLIAVDRNGNIVMPFNTEGMYRAFKKADGTSDVKIYKN